LKLPLVKPEFVEAHAYRYLEHILLHHVIGIGLLPVVAKPDIDHRNMPCPVMHGQPKSHVHAQLLEAANPNPLIISGGVKNVHVHVGVTVREAALKRTRWKKLGL